MKSYGYKLINYVFSVAVYDLLPPLNQFFYAIPPKILGSGIKEFVEPVFKVLFIVKGNAPSYGSTPSYGSVFKVLFIVEGNTPHMVQQRAEKDSNLWVQGPENTGRY